MGHPMVFPYGKIWKSIHWLQFPCGPRVPKTTTNQKRWVPGSAGAAAAGPFAGPLPPFLGEPSISTPRCVMVWVMLWVITMATERWQVLNDGSGSQNRFRPGSMGSSSAPSKCSWQSLVNIILMRYSSVLYLEFNLKGHRGKGSSTLPFADESMMGSKHWGSKRLTLGPFSWDVTPRGHPGSASEPHDCVHLMDWEYLRIIFMHLYLYLRKRKWMHRAKSGVETYLWNFNWSLMLDCCSIAAHGPLHPHNWSISEVEMFEQHNLRHDPANCCYLQSPAAGAAASAPASAVGAAWTFNMWGVSYPGFFSYFFGHLSLSLYKNKLIIDIQWDHK